MAEPIGNFLSRRTRRWLAAGLCSACIASVGWAEMAAPAAHDTEEATAAEAEEETTTTGESAAEKAPDAGPSDATTETATPPATDAVGDYQDAIDRVEMTQGAYAPELADLYLSLGNALLKAQSYNEAKTAFQKGMQVQRVNEGLKSLSQVPYLLSLADLESALGDAEAANNAMSDVYRLNASIYDASDPRMLPLLDNMLRWYMEHYRHGSPKAAFLYLENAENIAVQMAVIHMETLKLADAGAADSFRKVGAVQYALVRHVQIHGVPGEDDLLTSEFGQPTPFVQQISAADRYFRRGVDALKRAIAVLDQQADATAVRKAQALADLGDWYTVFDRIESARPYYRQAFESLDGDPEQVAEGKKILFGTPRLIDFPALVTASAENAEELEGVDVVFDINASGEPENLQLSDLDEQLDPKDFKKLKRNILKLRFRPPVQDGVPVSTKDFAYHYPVVLAKEKT